MGEVPPQLASLGDRDGTVRRLTMASLYSLGTRVSSAAVGVITAALLARHLEPSGYGQFSLALSILGVITQVADFGIAQATTARIANTADGSDRVLMTAVALRTLIALAASGAVIIIVLQQIKPTAALVTVVIVASAPLAGAGAINAATNARFRPEIAASISLGQSCVWLGAVAVGVRLDSSTLWFAGAFVMVSAVQCAGTVLLGLRFFRPAMPDRRLAAELLRVSWPIGILGIAVTSYYRLDSLILFGLRGAHEVGLYAAAYKFLDAAQLLPATLFIPLLPWLVKAAREAPGRAVAGFELALRLAVTSSTAVAGTLLFLSDDLVHLVFGSAYSGAAPSLRWLGLAFVGVSLGYVCTSVCIAVGTVKRLAAFAFLVSAVSLAAHWLVVPRYGATGAAAVTAVTELVIGGTGLLLVRAKTGWHVAFRGFVAPLGAATVFPLAWPLVAISAWLATAAALAVYIALLWTLGVMTPRQLSVLFRKEQL